MARTFPITSLFPVSVLDNVLLAIKGVRASKFISWRFMSSTATCTRGRPAARAAAFLDRRDTEVRNLSHGGSASWKLCSGSQRSENPAARRAGGRAVVRRSRDGEIPHGSTPISRS
jgi:hypothetical protein